jgi:hypothetical protein
VASAGDGAHHCRTREVGGQGRAKIHSRLVLRLLWLDLQCATELGFTPVEFFEALVKVRSDVRCTVERGRGAGFCP